MRMLAGEQLVGKDFHDTNYIFLSFVTRYLPVGVVGLDHRGDLYRRDVVDFRRDQFARRRYGDRHLSAARQKDASDHHYLTASRCGHGILGRFTRWSSPSTAGILAR